MNKIDKEVNRKFYLNFNFIAKSSTLIVFSLIYILSDFTVTNDLLFFIFFCLGLFYILFKVQKLVEIKIFTWTLFITLVLIFTRYTNVECSDLRLKYQCGCQLAEYNSSQFVDQPFHKAYPNCQWNREKNVR